MELLSDDAFWTWARARGIGRHPRFGATGSLAFDGAPDLWRPWDPPPIVSDVPEFIAAALSAALPTGPYVLWRRGGGVWYDGPDGTTRNAAIDIVVRAVQVPEDHSGALRFSAAEMASLWALVMAFYTFGWGVGEDLYIIPDDGTCILMTSHHGQLFGHFPNAARLDSFARTMADAGYLEPRDDIADPNAGASDRTA